MTRSGKHGYMPMDPEDTELREPLRDKGGNPNDGRGSNGNGGGSATRGGNGGGSGSSGGNRRGGR